MRKLGHIWLLSPSNTRSIGTEMKGRVIAYDEAGVAFSVLAGRSAGLKVTWKWSENNVNVPFGPPPNETQPGPRVLLYGIYPYHVIGADGFQQLIVTVEQGKAGTPGYVILVECGRWSVPDKKTGKTKC